MYVIFFQQDFLLAACGVVPSSDSKLSGTDDVTSSNDTPLQTTNTGLRRRPFSSLGNSTSESLCTEKRTPFQSPGNHLNKPAGSGNRNLSSKFMNDNNNSKKMCILNTSPFTRAGLQEQPPAKRFASDSNNVYFIQNNAALSNSYDQSTSSNCSNQRNIKFREKRDSRALSSENLKYMSLNSPQSSNLQGLTGKNVQESCSLNVFSGRKSLSETRQTFSNVKTPDTSYCRESKNMRDRQQINKTGNATGSSTDITSYRKKTSRKFPGPAGILPKLVSSEECFRINGRSNTLVKTFN